MNDRNKCSPAVVGIAGRGGTCLHGDLLLREQAPGGRPPGGAPGEGALQGARGRAGASGRRAEQHRLSAGPGVSAAEPGRGAERPAGVLRVAPSALGCRALPASPSYTLKNLTNYIRICSLLLYVFLVL